MVIKSLEVMEMSAEDLHNVNVIHRMDPYVFVSLSDSHKQRTHVHKNGGTSPRWVSSLTFPIDEARTDLSLVFEIMTKKTTGDKEVGRVKVPIADLLERQGDGEAKQMSRSVSLPSGETQGVLEFKYKFREELPGGCGNTPAPEQGPSRMQAWIGKASAVGVWVAGGVVQGVAGAVAGDLINGSEVTEDE